MCVEEHCYICYRKITDLNYIRSKENFNNIFAHLSCWMDRLHGLI